MANSGSLLAIALAHLRIRLVQMLRIPAFIVPTLAFPGLFFVFFTLDRQLTVDSANATLSGFAIFAVLGVAFFQFGVGVASDRTSPWERHLRTLPVNAAPRFAAQAVAGLVFASVAVLIVVVTATASTPVSFPLSIWFKWAGILLVGAVPFALFGIALGYWADPRAALPIANVIYLPLSYIGGLWVPPDSLPHTLGEISSYLPTRHLADAVGAVVAGSPASMRSILWLALFGGTCFAAALWGYWREEAIKYR